MNVRRSATALAVGITVTVIAAAPAVAYCVATPLGWDLGRSSRSLSL
jgi:hypothetical protein